VQIARALATGMRTPGWWAAAVVGLALPVSYLAGSVHNGSLTGRSAYFLLTMTVGIGVGLWAWAWRPGTHMGPLMFWWPALWLAGDLPAAFPDSRTASTIGIALFVMGPIAFAQMALSYPTGSLMRSRLAWVFVFVLGYAAQVVQNAYNLLFLDLSACPVCPPPRAPSWLHVDATPPISLQDWNDGWLAFVIAILPIGLFLLYRAYVRANPAHRRSLGPVVATATFITCTSWITSYAFLTDRLSVLTPISWLQTTGALAAALTALIGIAVTRRARGPVGALVSELSRVEPGHVRAALARALGDPTLELALRLPERGVWVDEEGRELTLPLGRERAVTIVGDDLAALVHDPVLLDQPALLDAAGSAARLALENERLQVALRAQLAELRRSRARLVRAGDEERRRLERDLHDGVQQRLLALGMALQRLRREVTERATATALVDDLEHDLRETLRELRELARGIHPAVLANEGLDAAVRALAQRAPLPVDVETAAGRLPGDVETATYFVVAEALANVAKHAHATAASVTIERRDGHVRVEVADDGVGGAGRNGSSGLAGLSDRVAALDGRLLVDSPRGGGTRLVAEIPCAS
jgi:signal transduction histidine kinase